MPSRFTHVVACVRIFLLFNIPLYVRAMLGLSIPSLCPWTLGLLLAIVNKAAMIVSVKVSLQDPAFHSIRYILRSEISGSYGNAIFNFLSTSHIVSQSTVSSYISINNALEFQFLHIFTNTDYVFFF